MLYRKIVGTVLAAICVLNMLTVTASAAPYDDSQAAGRIFAVGAEYEIQLPDAFAKQQYEAVLPVNPLIDMSRLNIYPVGGVFGDFPSGLSITGNVISGMFNYPDRSQFWLIAEYIDANGEYIWDSLLCTIMVQSAPRVNLPDMHLRYTRAELEVFRLWDILSFAGFYVPYDSVIYCAVGDESGKVYISTDELSLAPRNNASTDMFFLQFIIDGQPYALRVNVTVIGSVNPTDPPQVTSLPDDGTPIARDVSSADWFAGAVKYITDKGIMSLDSSGNFNPNHEVTLADAATVIDRILEKPFLGLSYSNVDSDVQTPPGYAPILERVTREGLLEHISFPIDGDHIITRADVAIMFYNAIERAGCLPKEQVPTGFFYDGAKMTGDTNNAMRTLAWKNLLRGQKISADDKLLYAASPTLIITRAELATLAQNAMVYLEGEIQTYRYVGE